MLFMLFITCYYFSQNYAVEEANENQQEHEVNEPEKKVSAKFDRSLPCY